MFSVVDVLKNLDPLVDENILTSKRAKQRGTPKQSIASLHPNVAQYSIVRVFVACKSNIKSNKNVTAHFNHIKNTCDMHSLHHSRVGG